MKLKKNQLFIVVLVVGIFIGCIGGFFLMNIFGSSSLSSEDITNLKTEVMADVDKKLEGLTVTNLPKKNNEDDKLNVVYQNVKEKMGAGYLPNYKMTKEELVKKMNISSDMYIEYFGEKAVENANIDEFIGFKVEVGKEDTLVSKLEEYQKTRSTSTSEYPTDLIKIKNAKVIKKEGFVFWVMLSNLSTTVINQGESAITDKVSSDTKNVVECIDKVFESSDNKKEETDKDSDTSTESEDTNKTEENTK